MPRSYRGSHRWKESMCVAYSLSSWSQFVAINSGVYLFGIRSGMSSRLPSNLHLRQELFLWWIWYQGRCLYLLFFVHFIEARLVRDDH